MLSLFYISKRAFSSKPASNDNKQGRLYGYALRDKFAAICHADLIAKVLNKTENDIMLLRAETINASHVDKTFSVYNGFHKYSLFIKSNMVGFKVGEFVPSRKIHNLKKGTLSVRRFYKRIEKPKAVLSQDRQDIARKNADFLKTLL